MLDVVLEELLHNVIHLGSGLVYPQGLVAYHLFRYYFRDSVEEEISKLIGRLLIGESHVIEVDVRGR